MRVLVVPLLAIVSGLAITLQGQFMGLMDRALGTKESAFITYVSGGLLAAALALILGISRLSTTAGLPWYAYTSGALGLVIVATVGFVIPRLGAAKGFTLILASQFLLAALIDHFGLFGAAVRPLTASRVVGLGTLLASVWLVVR
ncbi:MAG TPA: DMT family transporter [Anaerolineales bacterium]|nr:DMT family transporter [Anaerolineales bacterium]